MTRDVPPIDRIPLARSVPRLMAWPAVVTLTGALAVVGWALGSFGAGVGGLVFVVAGGALVVAGLCAGAMLLSVRLDVREAAVRVSWLGGARTYPLVRGAVTRIRLLGPGASPITPRVGFFGLAVGPARLRDEEDISVVRLARTSTAILVPTERGRLAIAAADEGELLDALSRAARAREQLDELTRAAPDTGAEPATPSEPVDRPQPPQAAPVVDVEPRLLTGIERALLEQRLAEERAIAEAAPADADASAGLDRDPGDAAVTAPVREPTVARAPGRRPRIALRRPGRSTALVLLPLPAAGVAWAIGVASGTYPDPGTDAGRLTALALVLAGPTTSVGAIMALTWWPRLVVVVVSGGLAASVFIARALLG